MSKIANYVQPGNRLDYLNSSEAKIAYGDVVSLTTRIGVACADIAAGEVGAIEVVGVYDLPKGNTAISVGAAVFWDAANKKITTTEGSLPAGWAVAAAAADDGRVRVKLG